MTRSDDSTRSTPTVETFLDCDISHRGMGRSSAKRSPNTPFEAAANDTYEVEAIEAVEAKRRKGGDIEYYVRWGGAFRRREHMRADAKPRGLGEIGQHL